MPARERIALRRDVHRVRVFVDLPEQLHVVFFHKVRSEPQDNVLDHRVPDVGDQHVYAHVFPEFLVEPPIQKAHDHHEQKLLAESRQIGYQPKREPAAADVGLQPLHQPHLPIEKENDACRFCHTEKTSLSDRYEQYTAFPSALQSQNPRFSGKKAGKKEPAHSGAGS